MSNCKWFDFMFKAYVKDCYYTTEHFNVYNLFMDPAVLHTGQMSCPVSHQMFPQLGVLYLDFLSFFLLISAK